MQHLSNSSGGFVGSPSKPFYIVVFSTDHEISVIKGGVVGDVALERKEAVCLWSFPSDFLFRSPSGLISAFCSSVFVSFSLSCQF